MTLKEYTKRMAELGIDRGQLGKRFKQEPGHANVNRFKVRSDLREKNKSTVRLKAGE